MSQATLLPSNHFSPSFPPLTYQNVPVLTTEMLAQAYSVDAVRIRQNLSRNSGRFLEGKHFYTISGNELKEFKHCVSFSDSVKIPRQTRELTLWTDRGAARHAKILETDTAWDVYELLEDTFFNVKPKSLPATLTPSTSDTRRPLEKLVKVWASQARMPHAQGWTQVNAHFNLNSITELPIEWIPDAIAFVEAKIDALPKALPSTPQPHLFDQLRLSPWDKVQMGKHVRQMLDSRDVGPGTMECILLKARYIAAIDDVYRLCNQLHTDLRKAVSSPYAAARQKVNTAGNVWTDSLTESIYADHYRIMELGKEFHSVAFRALNTGICVSRMMGM